MRRRGWYQGEQFVSNRTASALKDLSGVSNLPKKIAFMIGRG
jgi:hypothetical protein